MMIWARCDCRILISFAVVFLFWDVKAVFYALWSPFTFIMGYSDPRKPTDDKLKGPDWRSPLPDRACLHSAGLSVSRSLWKLGVYSCI